MRQLVFNPDDLQSVKDLISEYTKFPEILFGEDQQGNFITTQINAENITIKTLQKNQRTRVNVYWLDGTREEFYEK